MIETKIIISIPEGKLMHAVDGTIQIDALLEEYIVQSIEKRLVDQKKNIKKEIKINYVVQTDANKKKVNTFVFPKTELQNSNNINHFNLNILAEEKKFLERLKSIIFINLDKEILSINNIAEDMGMSRSFLFRKIKSITGKNIINYARRVRLDKAAFLIKEEKMTITQASFEVGYKNMKYFRKIFKEQFGILPSHLK